MGKDETSEPLSKKKGDKIIRRTPGVVHAISKYSPAAIIVFKMIKENEPNMQYPIDWGRQNT